MAQGLAEAGFEGVQERIAADWPADGFTFSQRCIIFIPMVLIAKVGKIIHARMQRAGHCKPVIHCR